MRLIDADEFWKKLCGKAKKDRVKLKVVYELLDEMPEFVEETENQAQWMKVTRYPNSDHIALLYRSYICEEVHREKP